MDDLGREHEYHGVQPVLHTSDVAEALAFYCDTLDFDLDFAEGEPPNYARVRKGDRTYGDPVYIHLSGDGARNPAATVRIHVGKDVDGLCAALAERGVPILSGPTTQPWGLREFAVRDPGGNELLFCGYTPVTDLEPGPPPSA